MAGGSVGRALGSTDPKVVGSNPTPVEVYSPSPGIILDSEFNCKAELLETLTRLGYTPALAFDSKNFLCCFLGLEDRQLILFTSFSLD